MANRYKNFMKLLEKWPLDHTKKGRDLGQHIRDCIKVAFNAENGFNGDPKACDEQYNSLKRLSENHYRNLYKREKTFTATGLTAEECKLILSTESLTYLEAEYNKGFFSNLFSSKK